LFKSIRPAVQLTAHQLAQQRERDLAEQQRLAEQRSLETKRMVSADEYAAAIEVQNRNRCEGMTCKLRQCTAGRWPSSGRRLLLHGAGARRDGIATDSCT
jgi:hypothetical protein